MFLDNSVAERCCFSYDRTFDDKARICVNSQGKVKLQCLFINMLFTFVPLCLGTHSLLALLFQKDAIKLVLVTII